MTEEQLLAAIDLYIKSNGNGSITGPILNNILKGIVQSIYAAMPSGSVVPDNLSLKIDTQGKLSLQLPTWSTVGNARHVKSIDFDRSGQGGGCYIKVDGRTIFGTGAGVLTTDNQAITPDVLSRGEDFNGPLAGIFMHNAYQSIANNGYLKLDTGATQTHAELVDEMLFTFGINPRIDTLMKLSTLSSVKATIGLAETITDGVASGVRILFLYDSSVDAYWHIVYSNGTTVLNEATIIEADTDEHLFSISVADDVIRFEIDNTEIKSYDISLPDDEMQLVISLQDHTAVQNTAIIDLYNVRYDRSQSTPDFSEAAAIPSVSKRLAGFISQIGTDAPFINFLLNEIGKVTTSYVSTGTFRLIKTGAFKTGKSVPNDKSDIWSDVAGNTITLTWIDEDTYEFTTKDSTGTLTNGILDMRAFLIEIFN